jgi:polysaccharide pyruvyl transferase WcaK-like protein
MIRPIDIGLLWHSDSNGNLGIGALTVGNMALVSEAAEAARMVPRFHLFQSADSGASYVEGIASRHAIDGRFMAGGGYWRALGEIDVMLDIGYGDSFADIYPNRRYTYHAATKALCLARGIPLVLSPQTIGPFTRQPHMAVARQLMERARAVFARDPLSHAAVCALAPGATVHLATDVAFALPYTPQPRGPATRVGINVSGLLHAGGYTGANEFGLKLDYRGFTDRLIEAFVAMPGVSVVLVPHVQTPGMPRDDDLTAIAAVAGRFPAVAVAPRFAGPSEAKSFISGLDFLVGARMHATIAAFSSGVPVVPVSYSRKFEGLYGGIGYDHVLPAKSMETDAAVAFVLDRFARRDMLRDTIAAARPTVDGLLSTYVDTLSGLIADAATAARPHVKEPA